MKKRISLNDEISEKICTRMASGKSLRAVCREDKTLPDLSTVFDWLAKGKKEGEEYSKYRDFAEQYARATELREEGYFADIVEIADTCEPDKGAVQKARLQVDARKWTLSKMRPKKYGDRIQNDIAGELTINPVTDMIQEITKAAMDKINGDEELTD